MEIQYPLIIFTVLQRLGLGTYIISVLFVWLAGANISLQKVSIVSIVLLGVGVLSSMAHLGRPDRVFNSFANIKSALSWEGILATVTGVLLLINAFDEVIIIQPVVINLIKLLTVFFAAAFLLTTGKLYWLKTRPAWDTPLVMIIFLISAVAAGFAGTYFWLLLDGKDIPQKFLLWLICIFLCTWYFQILYMVYLRKLKQKKKLLVERTAILVCAGGWAISQVFLPAVLMFVILMQGHAFWSGLWLLISFLIGLAFWQSGFFLIADQAPLFPEM